MNLQEKIKKVLTEFNERERIYFVEFDLKMNLLAQGAHWITLDTIMEDLIEKNWITAARNTQMSCEEKENRMIRLTETLREALHQERFEK